MIRIGHVNRRVGWKRDVLVASLPVVEKLTTGVVSVSWVDPDFRCATHPCWHYRIGLGTKPPVDLSFDELSGRLAEAQLVLQDESVPAREVFARSVPLESGCPVVDISDWGDNRYYLDRYYEPEIGWDSLGALGVRIASSAMSPICEYDFGNLRMLADKDSRIVGIRFLGIGDDQRLIIRQAMTGM